MSSNNEHQDPRDHSQFSLLKTRRFAPFFLTQFLGAFNDNVYKNSLMAMITFGLLSSTLDLSLMNNIGAMLFILPFFLFSALAGQLSDKYEKSYLIRRIKLLEIVIMCLGAIAFYFSMTAGLMLLLFLMGTQSAFFGPVKYSIIPQHLDNHELVGGNALVEMGTFLAILIGTLVASMLATQSDGILWVSAIIISVAILGYLVSRKIPSAPAANPGLKVRFNPFTETWRTISYSREQKSVFLAVLAISWFWFLGAAYLTQIYGFAKDYLGGDQSVVMVLLATFSIGIATGSLLCERLSGHKVELGLVPLGSIGLTIFGMDLFLQPLPELGPNLISASEFISQTSNLRIIADFLLIGIFGGFYIVPLYAMVQSRSEEKHRSQVIAAINIMNALFMVASAITGIVVLGLLELSIPQFFLILAVLNALVAIYIYRTIPEFAMRFIIWILTHTMYRVKHINLDNIPDEGAHVLVCNHVSFVDALLIGGACRRPVRFVTFKPIYHMPVLNFIFRTAKAIPIDSRKADPEGYEKAFERIAEELRNGEVVCIFPEGKLTTDGEIDEFKNGISRILQETPVPVIPMALRGLWGSFFSHKDRPALSQMPKRFWSKIELIVGDPIPAEEATPEYLKEKVAELRGERQ
ncbi:MAG: 1-acyl-sn-glycerol-3-phosphate acyltransferase [Thalassolituus sp.]|jgi:1-acyl-sn-glycerol-3-phosphate acyltransferase